MGLLHAPVVLHCRLKCAPRFLSQDKGKSADGEVGWGYHNKHLARKTEDVDWFMKDDEKLREADAQERAERDAAHQQHRPIMIKAKPEEDDETYFHDDARDYLPGGTVTSSPWQTDEELAAVLPNSGHRVCVLGSQVGGEHIYTATIGEALAAHPRFRHLLLLTNGGGAGLSKDRLAAVGLPEEPCTVLLGGGIMPGFCGRDCCPFAYAASLVPSGGCQFTI